MNFEQNDLVKVLIYPGTNVKVHPKSVDAEAVINYIYPDGSIWITNMNMPFLGTISAIIKPEDVSKTIEIV